MVVKSSGLRCEVIGRVVLFERCLEGVVDVGDGGGVVVVGVGEHFELVEWFGGEDVEREFGLGGGLECGVGVFGFEGEFGELVGGMLDVVVGVVFDLFGVCLVVVAVGLEWWFGDECECLFE